ncbi:MAG: leucine-rich repeat protein, partial [Clostridia bacterium]|nr:leucine-rich repeat protein [Clostridia bacterium]
MEENGRNWTDYTDEEKLLIIDGYLDGVVALDDKNERANKQRLEWLRGHIPAYKADGGKNYIFVSYSHLDYKRVYKDLAAFSYNSQRRVRFWYDEGLPVGKDWEKAAGELINNPRCVGVLFYLSKNLLLSPSVFKEIECVKNSGKPYFAIALNPEICSAEAAVKDLDDGELNGIRNRLDVLTEFFPDSNTALAYSVDNVSSRIDRIAAAFDVTEEVFSDFVCEETEGGLNLVAYRGNKTEVHIPARIGDKNIVRITADLSHAVSVYIPETVTDISRYAFENAGNLEKISVDADNRTYYDLNGVLCEKNGKTLLRVPVRWNWKNQFVNFKDEGERDRGLGRCVDLIRVLRNTVRLKEETDAAKKEEIDNRLKEFGYIGSKLDCRGKIDVNGNEADTYLDKFEQLFYFVLKYFKNNECGYAVDFAYAVIYRRADKLQYFLNKLKEFSIFNGIEKIEERAFEKCELADYVILPDSVNKIGCAAFRESSLKLIVLPNRLDAIPDRLFFNCSGLATVLSGADYYGADNGGSFVRAVLSGSIKSIGEYAFYNTAVPCVEFGENIGGELSACFENCGKLLSVVVPGKIKTLSFEFYRCFRLRNVRLS